MVSPPKYGGLKMALDADNNITISDYTLHYNIPLQLKKISARYNVNCGCECCISTKTVNFSLLTCLDFHMKQLKYQSHNVKNRRSGEVISCIFEIYNNNVIPYGCHIHNTATDIPMEKMFLFTYIPNWKCLLCYCDKFLSIVITIQEENKDTTNTCPTIKFHIYRNVSHFKMHERHPYEEGTTC